MNATTVYTHAASEELNIFFASFFLSIVTQNVVEISEWEKLAYYRQWHNEAVHQFDKCFQNFFFYFGAGGELNMHM